MFAKWCRIQKKIYSSYYDILYIINYILYIILYIIKNISKDDLKKKNIIDHLLFTLVCNNRLKAWYFNHRPSISPRGVRSRDRKNDSCWGSNGSSGRNRLTPNRPSFVCAINRLVLTTSAAPRQGVEFVRCPGRARPPESIGSHKHPRYNQPPPHGKLISIPPRPATPAIYVNAVLFCVSRQSPRWQYACAFTTSTSAESQAPLRLFCDALCIVSSPPPSPPSSGTDSSLWKLLSFSSGCNRLAATSLWINAELTFNEPLLLCLHFSVSDTCNWVKNDPHLRKIYFVANLVNQRNFDNGIILKKETGQLL